MVSTDIQEKIHTLIEERLSQLTLPEQPASLYNPVRYALESGGKRIRPYFSLTACGLCGSDIEEALPAAIAIELLHNFTLLHDDIMDAAPKRRGKASVYKKWNRSIAILSGDAMYARAFEQLQYYGASSRFSKEQYFNILNIFLESATSVCEGQARDLSFDEDLPVNLDAYMKMIAKKTAALITGAFKIGGKVANAEEKELKLLSEIGRQTGLAFQIQDDLLDVTGDPDKFGKKSAGDILKGKKTYLYILALQKSNDRQKDELQTIFKKDDISDEEVSQVISIYKKLNVFEAAREAVDHHYEQSIQHIETFERSNFRASLIELLINLKKRNH